MVVGYRLNTRSWMEDVIHPSLSVPDCHHFQKDSNKLAEKGNAANNRAEAPIASAHWDGKL